MKKKKLPKFKTEEEEANFWDTHSFTDYLDEFEEVDDVFILAPSLAEKIKKRSEKRLISIRLAKWEIDKTKQISKKMHIPYQVLIRKFINEGLHKMAMSKS